MSSLSAFPGVPTRGLVFAALLALALLAPAPTLAADGAQDRVVLSGDVYVPPGTTAGNVVVADGAVNIAGRVDGDVVALSGPVRVTGVITGSVSVISDRATLLPSARVGGDLRYGDERPLITRGATVRGEVSDEGWGDMADFPWEPVSAVLWWTAVSVSTLVLGLVLLALGPRAAQAAARTARARLGASVGWGAGLFFGLPAVAILAAVSLVGLPLGVGLGLALVPLGGVGYVTAAFVLGSAVVGDRTGVVLAFLAGWGMLRLAALAPFAGALIAIAAMVVGLGVLLVATWKARGPSAASPAQTPVSSRPSPA